MYGHIGNLPLTLIVRDVNSNHASELVFQIITYLKACSILRATAGVFSELGFENETHLVFRQADATIVPIENTSLGLYNGSLPYYAIFDANSFELGGLYAAYLDEQFNRTRHEVLCELGQRYQSVRFGVLIPQDLRVLDRVNLSQSTPTDFLIFSLTSGAHYPVSAMTGLDITSPNWVDLATKYIDEVLAGIIEPIYISEQPDPDGSMGALVRVVGTTYEAFVNDTTHDIVVFYYTGLESVKAALDEFQAAADEVVRNGTTTIKFGFIDVYKNACPRGFPGLNNNPHIEMFRAKNTTHSAPMFGMPVKGSFIRFFRDAASLPNTIIPEGMTRSLAEHEKEYVQNALSDMSAETATQARDYIRRLDVFIIQPLGHEKQKVSHKSEL
jgi:hypothetical protein